MPSTLRTAAFILSGALAIVGVGATLFYVQHHQVEAASMESAEAEFRNLRERFAGSKPLLSTEAGRQWEAISVGRFDPLHSFHTVVFDTRDGQRIVRISVPYPLVRFFGGPTGGFRWLGELTFLDDTEFDPEPITLSLAEIERHGPGLLVDYRHQSGGQMLVWVD